MVFLTGRRLLQLNNLTGTQIGSYFGHSIAVLDANGDGYDDVAIGAPLFSGFSDGTSGDEYETGRVYVVYQNSAVSTKVVKVIAFKRIIIGVNYSSSNSDHGISLTARRQGDGLVLASLL